MGRFEIAWVDQIKPGSMQAFSLEKKQVLVINLEGQFYAIDNLCTHWGGDLSKGSLDGHIVTCPRHGSKFDVITGECISGPKIPLFHFKVANEKSYQVTIEGEKLFVNL